MCMLQGHIEIFRPSGSSRLHDLSQGHEPGCGTHPMHRGIHGSMEYIGLGSLSLIYCPEECYCSEGALHMYDRPPWM